MNKKPGKKNKFKLKKFLKQIKKIKPIEINEEDK